MDGAIITLFLVCLFLIAFLLLAAFQPGLLTPLLNLAL
jgi:hypothetical protein